MEILNEIWVWIVSALGGVSLAGVISAAIYGCLKGAFSKTISKINVEKIADEATEKGIEKVKNTHVLPPRLNIKGGILSLAQYSRIAAGCWGRICPQAQSCP